MAPHGSGKVKVDLGTNPDIYVARVDWTPDGSALLVQRQSRDQKRIDLLRVNPETGQSKVLFSETSDTWVAVDDDRSEEHTSELQSLMRISYAVFCLKTK